MSGIERKLKKRSELSQMLEGIPENGIIRKDNDPSGLIDISPENQLKILQTLLTLKSQGIHVPEVAVNQVRIYSNNNFDLTNSIKLTSNLFQTQIVIITLYLILASLHRLPRNRTN